MKLANGRGAILGPIESSEAHEPAATGTRARQSRERLAPLLGSLFIVISGMSYSILWAPLVRHVSNWITPSDFWNTFRASQYVIWRGAGQIYNNPAAFQTFPGIAFILAPIAKLVDTLSLVSNFGAPHARPSAWLILGPVEMGIGSLLLFPLDSLTRRLSVSSRRRITLIVIETFLIWPSVALWGHPEDPLSLALGIYAMLAVVDKYWSRAGILFGLAIAVQPLIMLVVPIALALTPLRRWFLTGLEILVPSVLLLLPPLIQEWGPTTRLLLNQPNYLQFNHPTPWASLAPVYEKPHLQVVRGLKQVRLPNGHFRNIEVVTTAHAQAVLAAGPGRIVAVLAACLIGVFVKVRTPTMTRIIWLAALALSLRCVVEPVMVPYYLLPGLALALVAASDSRGTRFTLTVVASAACTATSYLRLSPWGYYLVMICPLIAVLGWSWPHVGAPSRQWSAVSTSSGLTRQDSGVSL